MSGYVYLLLDSLPDEPEPLAVYDERDQAHTEGRKLHDGMWYRVVRIPHHEGSDRLARQAGPPEAPRANDGPDTELCPCGHAHTSHRVDRLLHTAHCGQCFCVLSVGL